MKLYENLLMKLDLLESDTDGKSFLIIALDTLLELNKPNLGSADSGICLDAIDASESVKSSSSNRKIIA